MNASIKPEHLTPRGSDSEDCNTSSNLSFNEVLDARLSRRHVLRVSIGTAGAAVLGALPLASCGGGSDAAPEAAALTELKLSFPAVAKSVADAVMVPAGYTATVLYALGDPLTASHAGLQERRHRHRLRQPRPATTTTAWSTSA